MITHALPESPPPLAEEVIYCKQTVAYAPSKGGGVGHLPYQSNNPQLKLLKPDSLTFSIFQKGTAIFKVPSSSSVVTLPSGVATVGEKGTRKERASGRTRQEDSKDGSFT